MLKTKNKQLQLFLLLIIALASFIVYFQTISFNYVYCDDQELILKNNHEINNFLDLKDIFTKSYLGTNYYRPIITLSLNFDYFLGEKEPFYYHLTNVLLHIIFASLLFFVFKKINISPNKAFWGTLIYVVHPLFVNSVAWLVGRNDIIFSIFCMFAFLMFINFEKEHKRIYYYLHLIFLFVSFLSKETALAFPVILFCYMFLFGKEQNQIKYLKMYYLPWLFLYVCYIIIYLNIHLGNNVNNFGFDIFLYNLRVLPEFIAKFFFPIYLSVLPTYSLFNTIAGIVIIVLASILISGFYMNLNKENKKYIIFGIIWFLILVLPGCFISLKNSVDWNEYLETRAYLPMVGILIVLMNIRFPKIKSNIFQKAGYGILLIIILVLGLSLFWVSKNYSSPIPFYNNAIERDSSRPLFHYIIACLYKDLKKNDLSEKHILKAIELRQNNSMFAAFAAALYSSNNLNKAEYYFKQALKNDSTKSEVWENLGNCQYWQGKVDLSINTWENAIIRFPEDTVLYDYLSYSYLKKEDFDNADKYSNLMKIKGMNLSQISIDYYKLGMEKLSNSQFKIGMRLLKKSVELDSMNYDAQVALKKLNY